MRTWRIRKLDRVPMLGARAAVASTTVIAVAAAVVTTCSVTSPADAANTRVLSLDRMTIAAAPPSTTGTTPPPSGDSTAWLQSQFDALRPGETLTLPPGNYQHSGVLTLRVVGARLDGN